MENRAYKYRIYPTPQQETFLMKELGLKRLYWNLSLAAKNADHSYKLKSYKETFAELKPEALDWCKEIDSTAMADIWSDLTQAFRNFFTSCNGTRKVCETTKVQVKKEYERVHWLHCYGEAKVCKWKTLHNKKAWFARWNFS